MSSPSNLGDLRHQIACSPASTATTAFIDMQAGTDTGTQVYTTKVVDLSLHLGQSTTGGLPLDITKHPLSRAPLRQYRSIGISLPLELNFISSGKYVFFTTAHQHRSATSGAGSTWATIKTDTDGFRMGTDTDGVYHHGVVTSVNAQAIQRYYRTQVTVTRRLTSDSSAKDTTTGSEVICVQPSYLFGGAGSYPAQS